MFNYKQTLETMRKERSSLRAELEKLDRAISALASVVGSAARTQGTSRVKKRRQALPAQKLGSAQVIGAQAKKVAQPTKPKSKISAQGLRNIVEAQKKRWARVKVAAAKAKVSKA